MKTLLSPSAQLCSVKYNRIAYAGLLFAAIVLLILKDWQNGFCMLGISLVADPFDHRVTWAKRPLWQRSWLIVHLAILFAAMLYLTISKL
ncbi:hypothetical protein IDJ77_15955 [Mucilaginibacter sp. ZT4R22]|uniref:Uncharacterized protein n=1 Tax=Mucilaginibacter pankratovii TaxID=2772110 RepID=A0ABR7WSN3_9SPHI|nr:hypothetical protein [Mucilaginibacter pankratovii]MBD1365311.1 hypothetical protein [Mucilaginibacter pankratovii]